jgi:hypothetical protein
LMASSAIPRTPAGRLQFVIELAQAGVISTDVATKLFDHPDLEGELSLYTAAIRSIDETLDEIADGKIVMPEPFMNAAMCVWRGQREYLQWRMRGAPEARLEALRQFIVQAAWLKDQADQAALAAQQPANGNMPPAAGAAGPQGPGGAPYMQAEPGAGQPSAAFSPNAVNLAGGMG